MLSGNTEDKMDSWRVWYGSWSLLIFCGVVEGRIL